MGAEMTGELTAHDVVRGAGMPDDALMRWENEGGAVAATNEGTGGPDSPQPTRRSWRRRDRRDSVSAELVPDERHRAREAVAA
jgi:hypothetical protein